MLSATIATGDYDHVRDLVSGRIRVQGIEPVFLTLTPEEIFARFSARREWEVSEYSLALYVNGLGRGDDSLLGIPIFLSRAFRHGSFYARADGPSELGDLAGLRVGIPEWAQTAGVWARGILAERHGVDLASISWVQGGVDRAGRREKGAPRLPAGIEIRREQERSLAELLRCGEIDAVISARPPRGLGGGELRPLLADPRAAEEEYWREAGIFPIMHLLVVRRDFAARAPWAVGSIFSAFDEARGISQRRLADGTASHVPLPWVADLAAEAERLADGDPFPYGLEANRVALETFLRYATEQGVCEAPLAAADLFPAGPDEVLV